MGGVAMADCRESQESSQNCTAFRWTPPRVRAARLVFEDRLTDVEIAAAVGISVRQLYYWKRHPAFQARIARHLAALDAQVAAARAADTERWLARPRPAPRPGSRTGRPSRARA